MSENNKKTVAALQFLNKKGQGIVEFALVLAFCAGVGMAAREMGLVEALNKAFVGTSSVAEPSAIVAGKAEGVTSSTVTETVDEGDVPAQLPAKTDAKYNSSSDEANILNYLKDLAKYFKNSETKEDDIWNAYKGNKTYADADAETKVRHAALAMLGANDWTEVSDDYLKAIMEDNAWAFDTDDRTIHNFLNWYFYNVANASMEDLRTRNTYFTDVSADIITQMRDNDNLVNGDVYSAYLAIKKQFLPQSVTETELKKFAPVIGDYDTADRKSDEKKVFDYVKGLTDYFAKLDDKDEKAWNAFVQNQTYPLDSGSQDDKNAFKAMAAKANIEDIDSAFWIKIKENHNWVRDDDDTVIYDFLRTVITDESYSEKSDDDLVEVLVAGNKQFKTIGSTDSGKTMIKNMVINAKAQKGNLENEGVYKGYLAVKQEFWKDSKPVVLTISSGSDQNDGNLTVNQETMYGIQTNVLNVTDENWASATEEDRLDLMQKGTVFKYKDAYYVCTANDSQRKDINWVMQYGAVAIKNNIIDESCKVYRQDWWKDVVYLNVGDIIIKDNVKYVFIGNWGSDICYEWNNVKEDNNIIKID